MFIHSSAIVLAIAASAVASPGALEARQNNCNTGSIQCCNSVQSSSSSIITEILSLLGIPLSSAGSQVGITCSPISGVGSSCVQQPACCIGDTFNSLITIACDPITINL